MKEQFDKRLVEKIKDSFQNHEEPFDPIQWEKFSNAYFNKPSKNKKWAYWPFWTSGIAASFLLLFFFWPMEKERLETKVRTFADSMKIKGQPFEVIESPEKPLVLEDRDAGISPSLEARPEMDDFIAGVNDNMERVHIAPLQWDGDGRYDHEMMSFWPVEENVKGLSGGKILPSEVRHDKSLANTEEGTGLSAEEWVNNWKNAGGLDREDKQDDSPGKMRLGLVVGPQTASNSTVALNLGGGVMSEFSINDKLKLDVGVTYAQQRMNADNYNTLPEMMTMRASDVSSAYTNDYIKSDYSLNYSSLDIPVNLKYKVMDKSNSNLFVITGFSSMVYLDQSTTETYSVQSNFMAEADGTLKFEPAVQEFTATYNPEEGQSNVDLGRMLNLSLGYEYQLKNGTFISLEPYYKVPLGDMTFANQQFSIGGMNLRMNFQFKK